MSEIKVDTIGPRVDNGTLTIGASGDTVNIAGTAGTGFPAGTTLTGSTNNTVATVTGANALAGEANLVFDGSKLGIGTSTMTRTLNVTDTTASASTGIQLIGANNGTQFLNFGDTDDTNVAEINYDHGLNKMNFRTNDAYAMAIDTNGIITKPLQPCFFAYASSQSGIGSGTYDVIFANERFDLGGNFATPSFTAPVTGKYAFQMSVLLVNLQAGGNASVYFQVSNAEIRVWRQDTDGDAGTYETASGAIVIDMDANDTCKIQVNSSVDNDYIIDGGAYSTHFSGYLVA